MESVFADHQITATASAVGFRVSYRCRRASPPIYITSTSTYDYQLSVSRVSREVLAILFSSSLVTPEGPFGCHSEHFKLACESSTLSRLRNHSVMMGVGPVLPDVDRRIG